MCHCQVCPQEIATNSGPYDHFASEQGGNPTLGHCLRQLSPLEYVQLGHMNCLDLPLGGNSASHKPFILKFIHSPAPHFLRHVATWISINEYISRLARTRGSKFIRHFSLLTHNLAHFAEGYSCAREHLKPRWYHLFALLLVKWQMTSPSSSVGDMKLLCGNGAELHNIEFILNN